MAAAFWPFGTERERGFHHHQDRDRDPQKEEANPLRRNGRRPSILIKGLDLLTYTAAFLKSDSCKAGKGRSALLHRYNFALSFSSVFASDRGCVSSV